MFPNIIETKVFHCAFRDSHIESIAGEKASPPSLFPARNVKRSLTFVKALLRTLPR
jgi:hypothetical protein